VVPSLLSLHWDDLLVPHPTSLLQGIAHCPGELRLARQTQESSWTGIQTDLQCISRRRINDGKCQALQYRPSLAIYFSWYSSRPWSPDSTICLRTFASLSRKFASRSRLSPPSHTWRRRKMCVGSFSLSAASSNSLPQSVLECYSPTLRQSI
jgi:hypothetical protein